MLISLSSSKRSVSSRQQNKAYLIKFSLGRVNYLVDFFDDFPHVFFLPPIKNLLSNFYRLFLRHIKYKKTPHEILNNDDISLKVVVSNPKYDIFNNICSATVLKTSSAHDRT